MPRTVHSDAQVYRTDKVPAYRNGALSVRATDDRLLAALGGSLRGSPYDAVPVGDAVPPADGAEPAEQAASSAAATASTAVAGRRVEGRRSGHHMDSSLRD